MDSNASSASYSEIRTSLSWASPFLPLRRADDGRARPAAGETLGGRYALLHPIGRGAMGEVFLADDLNTRGQVAVKLLPPYGASSAATRARVESEALLHRLVEHANVVRLLDQGHTTTGRPYVVTEALVGETLGERLRKREPLSIESAVRLAREAARGLSAVHRAGIVHRDVKPDNLFLCDERVHGVSVKVLDFGFAARCGVLDGSDGEVLGTLEYLAPEQALAEPVDSRADVYSLGVVLFRALTGELPFDACARRGLVAHQLASPVPPPSWLRDAIPPELDTVVGAATRKHPDNRYGAMEALLIDLDRILKNESPMGAPTVVSPDAYQPVTENGRLASRYLLR